MTNIKDTTPLSAFEIWLRTVCFQPPTPEAYDLAKSAWQAARTHPVERVAMSDAEIATIGYVEFGIVADDAELVAFARAILEAHGLSAQTELASSKCTSNAVDGQYAHIVAVNEMVTQSTDAENVSKTDAEINTFPPIGSQWLHTNGSTYTVMHCANRDSDRSDYPPTVVYHNAHGKIYAKPLATWYRSRTLINTPRITQPLIAEAARDNADSQMAMVGACLAHVALNYSRRIGHTLESDDCTLLRKLHDQWVSAIAAVKRDDATPDYKAFALSILQDSRDGLGHDIDGGFVQDEAVKHRLLIQFEAKEPCGDNCMCSQECGEWPVACFRYSSDVIAAIAASAQKEE